MYKCVHADIPPHAHVSSCAGMLSYMMIHDTWYLHIHINTDYTYKRIYAYMLCLFVIAVNIDTDKMSLKKRSKLQGLPLE